MDDKKRKFMIEISVSFYDKEEFEHEGYIIRLQIKLKKL